MLEGFSPEERDAFADYLQRAHANLRAYGRKLAQSAAEGRVAGSMAGEGADGRSSKTPSVYNSEAGAGEVTPHA